MTRSALLWVALLALVQGGCRRYKEPSAWCIPLSEQSRHDIERLAVMTGMSDEANVIMFALQETMFLPYHRKDNPLNNCSVQRQPDFEIRDVTCDPALVQRWRSLPPVKIPAPPEGKTYYSLLVFHKRRESLACLDASAAMMLHKVVRDKQYASDVVGLASVLSDFRAKLEGGSPAAATASRERQ
jgi:hypothetical protein